MVTKPLILITIMMNKLKCLFGIKCHVALDRNLHWEC